MERSSFFNEGKATEKPWSPLLFVPVFCYLVGTLNGFTILRFRWEYRPPLGEPLCKRHRRRISTQQLHDLNGPLYRPVNFMALASLTRAVALCSVLLLLVIGAVAAGHHHEDDDVRHDCALCAAGSLNPSIGSQSATSSCLTAAHFQLPGPQGPPLWALYRGCLLSRAPPVPA